MRFCETFRSERSSPAKVARNREVYAADRTEGPFSAAQHLPPTERVAVWLLFLLPNWSWRSTFRPHVHRGSELAVRYRHLARQFLQAFGLFRRHIARFTDIVRHPVQGE